ncbi:hypothetical protein F5888DRAFT_565547 [Russula emetica]|nr:hypothetical protein F5888DRAFT_565547 [Russula emetica]
MQPGFRKGHTNRSYTPYLSRVSNREPNFRDEVVKRDGNKCILTLCAFCPTSRVTTTLKIILDVIESIDSPRNGLFLNSVAHRVLGTDLTILTVNSACIYTESDGSHDRTPNFAMKIANIDIRTPPGEKRCIFDENRYPPAILLEAFYVGAVVRNSDTERKGRHLWRLLRPKRGHERGTSKLAGYHQRTRSRGRDSEKRSLKRQCDERYETRQKACQLPSPQQHL